MPPPPPPAAVLDAFGPPAPAEDPLLGQLAAVALEAATRAGAVLTAAAGRPAAGVATKTSATDMVSDADRGAEAAVAEVLGERRPDDGLLAEEGTARPGTTGVRWVVDPLDGTTNFLLGIPQWSVSVAAEVDGRPVVGVVLDPGRAERWAAVEGRPARCGGREVRVAEGRSSLGTALVATGFGYAAERRAWQAGVAAHVLPRVRDLRRFGSAALDLSWVAGGRVDAYYEWGLNPWDLAAGQLLVRCAGGRAEALPGRLVVATTASLWGPLVDLLSAAGGLDPPDGPEPRHW